MKTFLKIYFWQVISIIFNFGAVFVVTPYISTNQSLYGIYMIVTSAYLFISYADFGFLSAAMKYASESYAKKDSKAEIEVIGFSGMVFLLFILLYSFGILITSFSPKILVPSINDGAELEIARGLLITLACFCPVFVVQRVLQIIFGVRLQDYKFQRILILSNLAKLLSAIFFFGSGKYLIVEYFLFSQLCTLFAVIVGVIIAKKSLNYDLVLLLKSFRLSKKLFYKTKKLAFTSLFLTLCWILYYELDTFVIARTLGAKSVAIFAIGLTIMTYFRSIFGVFFTPFVARFNHFVGLNDKEGLKKFFMKVIVVFLPITVFPVLAIFLTTENFILTWVGPNYLSSVRITQIMLLSYVFSFISYPSGILIMAYERVKALYVTSALQPLIYWVGIILTYPFWGLESFAYFKFAAFFMGAIVYLVVILKIFEIKFLHFFKAVILPALPPLFIIALSVFFMRNLLPVTHNKLNLLLYFLINGGVIFMAIMTYYFTSAGFRNFVNHILNKVIYKFFGRSFVFLNKTES